MRVIADLHIHGRYSRATSQQMNVEEIARFARIKGLNLVGTGDFTHPRWLSEIKEKLVPEADSGLYRSAKDANSSVFFITTTEVCTVFTSEAQIRKIHHVILSPNMETALQINDRLSRYGDLTIDGRPTLNMDAAHLVEEVMAVSSENMIFPAHAWTPWFSIFGAFNGFDSVEECYQDMAKHIHALETGLSSDPPMNWRLSGLDRYSLVSNSDSHSFWPWRIGREANVFDLETLTYHDVVDAICSKSAKRFKFTIETDPAYGKYHWTGHRKCHVMLSPEEATKLGNVCPVCRRELTKGVEQRVEELADRPSGFKPDGAVGFVHLLPLSEIIAAVLGCSSPYVGQVWSVYDSLVQKFGNEYAVLMDAPLEALLKVADESVARAIVRVREGQIRVMPGYDGVYGQLMIFDKQPVGKPVMQRVQQLNLRDFV